MGCGLMATAYVCDGCGNPSLEVKKLGRVLVRDYCAECTPRADAFSDAEEDLRKRFVEQFNTDRALLVSSASEGGFKLPDVPDAG